MNFQDMSDSELLATLDDIVQRLARKNNVEWAELRNEDKIDFNRIKLEFMCRLTERLKS